MVTLSPSQKAFEENPSALCLHRGSRDLTVAAARQAIKALRADGSDVTLRYKSTDRYGRSVEEVIRNRSIINQSLVKSGNAFVYSQ